MRTDKQEISEARVLKALAEFEAIDAQEAADREGVMYERALIYFFKRGWVMPGYERGNRRGIVVTNTGREYLAELGLVPDPTFS